MEEKGRELVAGHSAGRLSPGGLSWEVGTQAAAAWPGDGAAQMGRNSGARPRGKEVGWGTMALGNSRIAEQTGACFCTGRRHASMAAAVGPRGPWQQGVGRR